jgi:integrase
MESYRGTAVARRARGYWTEQRGKHGIWRLCWTEARRKRTRSLGTADEAAADQWFDRFLAELDQPPRPEVPTVSSIVDGYLAGREGVVTDYARAALTARHIKAKLGWIEADALRPSDSATYARQRQGEGISDGTIRRELTTLRAALHWAAGERLISAAPAVRLPPKPAPRDRWLTRDEADRLLGACVSHHVRLFILVALHTAARRNAILELRWPQVDLHRRLIAFNPPGRRQTTKRRVVVPINDSLHTALTEAKAAAQTEWVIEYDGQRVGSIKKAFARTAERAGMPEVTPHVLRHSAATWMAMAGIPMRKIALYLGHESERTTEAIYAHHAPDFLRDAARSLE